MTPNDIKPNKYWSDFLSEPVLEMIDLVGSEDAFKMLAAFGGSKVYVPVHLERSHPNAQSTRIHLKDVVKESSMIELIDYCGGEHLSLPKVVRLHKLMIIHDLLFSGLSASQIASSHRISTSHVEAVKDEFSTITQSRFEERYSELHYAASSFFYVSFNGFCPICRHKISSCNIQA
ncbi:hypothetical protein AAFX24_07910 [Vibrio mediterranei]|uniref:hypothetical protein n=1 Tax=Vibrio mediterranei TaxID=689 RepID=UPI0038CE817D